MKEITALLLCKLGGQDGTADEIKAVLTAAGLEANEDALSTLLGDMEGKELNELLAAGSATIKKVPFGGGGGGGGGGAGGAAAGGAAAAEAAPVEEEKEEEMEAPAVDMFGSGGGGGDY